MGIESRLVAAGRRRTGHDFDLKVSFPKRFLQVILTASRTRTRVSIKKRHSDRDKSYSEVSILKMQGNRPPGPARGRPVSSTPQPTYSLEDNLALTLTPISRPPPPSPLTDTPNLKPPKSKIRRQLFPRLLPGPGQPLVVPQPQGPLYPPAELFNIQQRAPRPQAPVQEVCLPFQEKRKVPQHIQPNLPIVLPPPKPIAKGDLPGHSKACSAGSVEAWKAEGSQITGRVLACKAHGQHPSGAHRKRGCGLCRRAEGQGSGVCPGLGQVCGREGWLRGEGQGVSSTEHPLVCQEPAPPDPSKA